MPNPTLNDVHVNRPLTNMAINYIQDQDKFIADQVFPYLGVQKQSDKYFEYDVDDLLRDEAKQRAPASESAGGGYRVDSTGTYSCNIYAYHKDVADQIRANSDSPLRPDQDAVEFVMQKLLIQRERQFATDFMAGDGTWDTEADPGDWSSDSGNPIEDIWNYAETIESYWDWPNICVMGKKVFTELANHTNVLDRYKYTQEGVITEDLIARVLNIENLYVGHALYSSTEEGVAATRAYCIPEEYVLLAYAAPRPSLTLPSAGYTFGWEGLTGADGMNITMKTFRMEELEADRVEGQFAYDMQSVCTGLGVLLKDCVS